MDEKPAGPFSLAKMTSDPFTAFCWFWIEKSTLCEREKNFTTMVMLNMYSATSNDGASHGALCLSLQIGRSDYLIWKSTSEN